MAKHTESFQESVVAGVAWTSLGLILIRVFFFVTSIITARLLTPDDFGIIGMAATITLLIDTTSANGIDNFIIYKQVLLGREINTAFMLNTVIAVILALFLIVAGPFFAAFYHQPKLNVFLCYAGLAFLVAMLGRIPRAFLIKEMRQSILSVIDIVSNFVNFALIIYLAMTGFQYLSYVISLLVSQTLRTILLFILARKRFWFAIDSSTMKDIFAYSKNYLPQTILSYCLTQADYIIGGMLLGSTLLGYYYFGFEKAFLVVMLVRSMAVQVFFPIFAKYQSQPEMLWQKYSEISTYSMFLLYPILFIMLLYSQEFISLLYGHQWENSLFTFQCLLTYTFLCVTYDLSVILFNAIGKPEQNLRHFASIVPLAIVAFYLGAFYGGLYGLSLVSVLVHSTSAILMVFRLKRYFNWSIRLQSVTILRCLAPLLIQLPLLLPLKFALERSHFSESGILLILLSVFASCYLILSKWINPSVLENCRVFFLQKMQAMFNFRLPVKESVMPGVEA